MTGATSTTARRRRELPPARSIVAVSVLSAVLASGSTVALVAGLGAGERERRRGLPVGDAGCRRGREPPGRRWRRHHRGGRTRPAVGRDDHRRRPHAERFSPFQVPTNGVGSGVILTTDGYILTNRHVVEDSQSLTVAFVDGTELPATIVKISDTRPRPDQGRTPPASGRRRSATRTPSSRPDRDRDRQPARHVHRDRHPGIVSGLDREITVMTRRPAARRPSPA